MANSTLGRISNNVTTFLVGAIGLNIQGAEVLDVRGRKSGQTRSLVVNPLDLDGETYLMSPRGETNWVRNMRVSGGGTLRRGRRSRDFRAHELTDKEKLRVMQVYLQRWGWQVRSLMGVDGKASEEQIRAILPKHPVFLLTFR